ncbi:MAG: SdrD B-like domain-containing protein, partial [Verrucomicrobiota bacterium]
MFITKTGYDIPLGEDQDPIFSAGLSFPKVVVPGVVVEDPTFDAIATIAAGEHDIVVVDKRIDSDIPRISVLGAVDIALGAISNSVFVYDSTVDEDDPLKTPDIKEAEAEVDEDEEEEEATVPEGIGVGQLFDFEGFAFKLKAAADPVSEYLVSLLDETVVGFLEGYNGGFDAFLEVQVVEAINEIVLSEEELYDEDRFRGIELNEATQLLIQTGNIPDATGLALFNRALLEGAYPEHIPQAAVLNMEAESPLLKLDVDNLLLDEAIDAVGAVLGDLFIIFREGTDTVGTIVSGRNAKIGQDGRLEVRVPSSVTLGDSSVAIRRVQLQFAFRPYDPNPTKQKVIVESAPVRLPLENRYVYTALTGNPAIAVLDGEAGEIVARVGLEEGAPRATALAPNLAKVYATLEGTNKVAVLDTLGFRFIDFDTSTDELDHIELPEGARAFQLAVDPLNQFLYVTDQAKAAVYVVNISPGSPQYAQTVYTFEPGEANGGLTGISVDADGSKVYIAAPNSRMFDGTQNHIAGNVIVAELDRVTGSLMTTTIIQAANEPYGVTSGAVPGTFAFTNRQTDGQGFSAFNGLNKVFTDLNIGPRTDAFDVNNGIGVAVRFEGDYAFVTGFNQFIPGLVSHDPNIRPFTAGGNIGVIKDPFGSPELVAATLMVPNSFPDNVVLSPDGTRLFAAYRAGMNYGVYVYNVEEIIKTIEAFSADQLERTPLDQLNPEVFLGRVDTGFDRPRGLSSIVTVGPDLIVSIPVGLNKFELGEQGTVTYDVGINRNESALAGNWTERVVLTGPNGFEVELASETFDSEGRRSIEIQFPSGSDIGGQNGVTAADLDSFKIRVEIDTGDTITEPIEVNNVAEAKADVLLPNLTVGSLTRPWMFFNNSTRIFEVVSETSEFEYTIINNGDAKVQEGVLWIEELWLGTSTDVDVEDDLAAGIWHTRLGLVQGGGVGGEMQVGDTRTRTLDIDFDQLVIPDGVNIDDLVWVVRIDVAPDGGSTTNNGDGDAITLDETPRQTGDLVQKRTDDDTGSDLASVGSTNPFRFETQAQWTVDLDDRTAEVENGIVDIGLEPPTGLPFIPLIRVEGKVFISFESGNIFIEGDITFLEANLENIVEDTQLTFFGVDGKFDTQGQFDVETIFDFGGIEFRASGLDIVLPRPASPGLTEVGPIGTINMFGDFKLPDDLVPEDNRRFANLGKTLPNGFVSVDRTGMYFTTNIITSSSNPLELNVGGLKMKMVEYQLRGFVGGGRSDASLIGVFELTDFDDAKMFLAFGNAFLFFSGDLEEPFYEVRGIPVVEKIEINKTWSIRNLSFNIQRQDDGNFNFLGTGFVINGEGTEVFKIDFKDAADAAPDEFRLDWTLSRTDAPVNVSGLEFEEDLKFKFNPDRDGDAGDKWNPQLELAGTAKLSEDLTGEEGDVDEDFKAEFEDEEGERLLINEDGLQNGEDNQPEMLKDEAEGRVFKTFKAIFEDASLTFALDDDGFAQVEFRAKITLSEVRETPEGSTSERSVVLDFSGPDKFIKLTAQGIIVQGSVELNGPFNITPSGSWQLKNLILNINSSPAGLVIDGTAIIKAPRSAEGSAGDTQNSEYILKVTVETAKRSAETGEIEPAKITMSLEDPNNPLKLNLLSFEFIIRTIRFETDRKAGDADGWDPLLALQGSAKLPEKITGGTPVTVDIGTGDSGGELQVTEDGVAITGGAINFESEVKFNLLGQLEVIATNAQILFVYTDDEKKASLTGTFIIPSLNAVEITIEGEDDAGNPRQITVEEADDGEILLSANLKLEVQDLQIYQSIWLREFVIDLNKAADADTADINAEAKIEAGGETVTVGIVFANGLTESISLAQEGGTNLGFFGVTLSITSIVFLPDRNPNINEDFWEPELQLQGELSLPEKFGSLIGGGRITGMVAGNDKFVINEQEAFLTGGSITFGRLEFTLFGEVEVLVEGLKLTFTREEMTGDSIFKINGDFNFDVRGVMANIDLREESGRFVMITRRGGQNIVDLRAQITIQDIVIVRNRWELKNLIVTIDTTTPELTFGIKGDMLIPGGMVIGAEIFFLNGKLNDVELELDLRGRVILLGNSGLQLLALSGSVNNISDPNIPLSFTGSITAGAIGSFSVNVPEWVGIGSPVSGTPFAFQITATIDRNHLFGEAKIVIIGDSGSFNGLVTGRGFLDLNWNSGSLTVGANLSAFGGLVTESGTLRVTSNPGAINLTGGASIRFPEISPIPSWLQGSQIGGGSVRMWVPVDRPQRGFVHGSVNVRGTEFKIEANFDGLIFFRAGTGAGALQIGGSQTSAITHSSSSFTISQGAEKAFVGATWSVPTSEDVDFVFTDPNGVEITESEFAARGIVIIDTLTDDGKKVVEIESPLEGTWTLTVQDPGDLGLLEIEAIDLVPQVSTTVARVEIDDENSAEGRFIFEGIDPSENPLVQVYYDTDANGFDGTPIGVPLELSSESGSMSFSLVDLPVGSYYIYAEIYREGEAVESTAYSNFAVQSLDDGLSEISGKVYQDSNGNGILDTGEVGVSGWTVFVDANDDGILNEGELSSVTDQNGDYVFNLERGEFYKFRLQPKDGFVVTDPDPLTRESFEIVLDGDEQLADFGVFETISAQGVVFLDVDSDGERDAGEILAAGREVFADLNENGQRDPGEAFVLSGPDGSFLFENLGPEATVLRVVDGINGRSIQLVSGADLLDLTLAASPTGSIRGVAYLDENINAQQDVGEIGLQGIQLFVDDNGNGILDLGERFAATDLDGNYEITGVPFGTHLIVQTPFAGFNSGAPRNVTLDSDSSDVAGVDFANRLPGFFNGDFEEGDSTQDAFGWTIRGNAAVENGVGKIGASEGQFSQLSQTFVVPENVAGIRFSLVDLDLAFGSNGLLSDAFEVTLTFSRGGQLLPTTAADLTETDSVLNVQPDARAFFSDEVTLSTNIQPGEVVDLSDPVQVRIDLNSVAAGTRITVAFKLTGSDVTSSVTVDNVEILTGPPLAFEIDPADDSGTLGDGITNVDTVRLIGQTDPFQ